MGLATGQRPRPPLEQRPRPPPPNQQRYPQPQAYPQIQNQGGRDQAQGRRPQQRDARDQAPRTNQLPQANPPPQRQGGGQQSRGQGSQQAGLFLSPLIQGTVNSLVTIVVSLAILLATALDQRSVSYVEFLGTI